MAIRPYKVNSNLHHNHEVHWCRVSNPPSPYASMQCANLLTRRCGRRPIYSNR